MTDPNLDTLLDDPALDVDDAGRARCVPCDVVLGPVASVGLVVQCIRDHLGS